MKYFTIDGKTTDYLPDPCKGVSPMTEQRFKDLGGEIEDDGTCWTAAELEFQTLACCTTFKAVCGQIAEFMGVDVFFGGYDDILAFQQSEQAQENPVQALMLAMMWQGADDDCNYRAQKLGIGRPRWWYCCWDIDPDNPEVAASGPVNAE